MEIFDDFKDGISKLKQKVELFKAGHPMISDTVSEIIDSFPFPFNAFGRVLWNGLEQKNESAEELLVTLQKMVNDNKSTFEEITLYIKELMDTNPTNDDILQVSKQIRESEKLIIDILGNKINNLSQDMKKYHEESKKYHEELKKILNKIGISSGTIDPNFNARKLQEYEEIIKTKEQIIEQLKSQLSLREKDPPEFLNLSMQLANFHYYIKEYNIAVARYGAILDYESKNIIAINNKGLSLHSLGKYDEAIKQYDQALSINPEYAEALSNKGLSLHSLGKYDEAIKQYDQALSINPEYAEALSNKGVALHSLGKYDEAIKQYDQALSINPEYAVAVYNKSCCYALMVKIDESLSFLDKAISLDNQYKKTAMDDKDFTNVKDDERFKKLVYL